MQTRTMTLLVLMLVIVLATKQMKVLQLVRLLVVHSVVSLAY
jgi:hypothetical protein